MTTPAPMWADWPSVLQQVAEVCGAGAALRLAATYGGRELYIPQPDAIDEGHPLALHLGLATARAVARVLGTGQGSTALIIPMGPASSVERRKQAMRRMRAEGKSNSHAAKVLGVHRRTVELRHQVDRRLGLAFKDTDTLDLFED